MGSKSAAGASPNALIKALRLHLEASQLPGDAPAEKAALDEAAAFLLASAQPRAPGQALVQIESASDGRRHLRIAIINEDMPFLVDSVAATIAMQGVGIDRLLHPVIAVERDARGAITALAKHGEGAAGRRESLIYIETPRIDARQRRELLEALEATLGDVHAAVNDWPKMQAAMAADRAMADPVDAEAGALLGWLGGGMLTQLGHLTRHRDGTTTDVLGICTSSSRELLAEVSLERAFDWFDRNDAAGTPRALLAIKSNTQSRVHRVSPLDLFIVPVRDAGKIAALSIHAGLWTSAALASRPQEVPVLRATLSGLTEQLGFDPAGHNGKALVHAFTSLPNDLLTAFDPEKVGDLVTAKMALIDRPRPRMVMVRSTLERHAFAFVWLPRDQLSTDVRLQIQAMLLGTPGAALLDWSLEVESSTLALLRFLIDVRGCDELSDDTAIEAQLVDLLRGWNEAVSTHLAADGDEGRAAALATRYAPAFPTGYRLSYGPEEAARDIARLRALALGDGEMRHDRGVRLYRMASDGADTLRLKVYILQGKLALSDAVPALENFGFRVAAEIPTFLTDPELGSIHDFLLTVPAGLDAGALLERAALIEAALADVLNAAAEDDSFNRLTAATGLAPREANWMRAIYRYLRQTGVSYTIYTVVDALVAAPHVTRAMVALFAARHDPAFSGERDEAIAAAQAAFTRGLAKVTAINDDRLLRLYRAVIDAVLRTNAFAPAAAEALAFKIDSSLVPGLPKPLPWREIFVYSRRVEGIHLRSGAVARGGLRWSDRRDDFRTEVLGLMKAQRVKNAVIVPTGAKGGFYPKQLPSPAIDREGWAAEGRASYEIFIRTLLSVTDNIVEGRVVHPDAVQVLDGEDPYFVVAADKGTATFSDIANGIAQGRDFWLDDAFASGGSNGYDHKAMGITARGAWVSVQRHFREMGIDVQSDSVTVAGCGDMSGDVFGNGMLLSKALKLVAAFDHRHIFIDPAPDPLTSWKERARMFALPRSSWEDYDAKLISKGGGVFPRSAKSIKLSKQAREALGIEAKEIEPEALISAILRAPVDLLWFGGIGTYIKAPHESHIQVGDPANDGLRIDADEVQARVIGEGANLGTTQAGRIAFSLAGGRINTDFIDNSAGVDCSDNEVNIKIALAAATASGKLSEKKRNTLLAAMTDEVAAIVLEDNRLQALALSVAESGGAGASSAYVRLIERLEEVSDFDRRTEGLADGETFLRRAADGQGLTRPELAVLLSSAKLALQDAIEASALPDDPMLEPLLIARFPTAMRKAYAAEIRGHRLRREMIATSLSNRIVNRMGMVHPFELAEEEGVGLAEVAAAFVVAERLFGLEALWRELDEAAIPEAARLALFDRLAAAVGNLMSDVLRTAAGKIAAGAMIDALAGSVTVLTAAREELLTAEPRARSTELQQGFVATGAPAALAGKVANLFDFDGAVGLAQTALDTGIDAKLLTHAFTDVGTRLGLDWAQGIAAHMSPSDVWERLLVSGLARDFQQMRIEFLRRLMRRKGGKDDPAGAVGEWAERNRQAVAQFRAMIARAQARPPVGAAMLAQIASQARNLLER
ncbi:NAD-glutamate dehydrogenase [Porphyrobacter sp. AAP60]|uniref:NAD-glutamate dehydrogenase n=1 Tax=Porphyrobacter sp. AAP60 TaxID=1523423 RepID=UPI0006B9C5A0|nr:NAD-glutamate dehydrogenase domain-containing protein [Porphyrobacter sp. AAP60]KPF64095.1 glutamate dehydrogenase [Porphyrobacter sp. AAP60]